MPKVRPCLFAALMLVAASSTSAQTAEALAREFGLLGTWAADCTKPADKANIHSTYAVEDGQVLNNHDAGPDFHRATFVVRSARPTGMDLLLLQTVSAAGQVSAITLRRIGDKMQIWRVVASDQSVPVNDGKFMDSDAAIPALSKCD